uniref:Uncharacterized protein n=1 Tax=Tanacetum cinerariifolium TaxID=118510 RepID=A0A6L2KBC9_TANCI|nr:hypothetical protein [Tanacetum cinerariifolium]
MKDRCRKLRKKVDMSKALDTSLVITKRSVTKSEKHDTSSSLENDADTDDADIKPVYDEEPMAEVPSHKTTNRNKPVKKISVAKKPERYILTGHRFLIKKTSIVHEKTKTPRSCLRWKPTVRILKTVVLKWVSIGMIFTSSTTTVDSELLHGSNIDNTNLHECIQTLNLSVGKSINVQKEQTLNLNIGTLFNLKKERFKVWIKENLISGRSRLRRITLIQDISARQSSHGI